MARPSTKKYSPAHRITKELVTDKTGLFPNKDCIETRTGKVFNVINVDYDAIDMRDIASGLSKTCRFGGQCSSFYSVAEHSFHCWKAAQVDGICKSFRIGVLLHDAHEAYMHDICRATKRHLPDYIRIADNLQNYIERRFLPADSGLKTIVKRYDNCILMHEAHRLMKSRGKNWSLGKPCFMSRHHPVIRCWKPETAEYFFLRACDQEGIFDMPRWLKLFYPFRL